MKKGSFYLLRKLPKTCNEFYLFCVYYRVFVFPSPRPFAWPLALTLASDLSPWPWSRICINRSLAPICNYQPCLPICIYRPWPTTLLQVRVLSLHIPTLSSQFVFVFTVLAYNLYYWSGA